jgi:hypothetical protein
MSGPVTVTAADKAIASKIAQSRVGKRDNGIAYGAAVEAAALARQQSEAASKQWRDAVDDALTNWMATSDSFPDARTAVRWLIEREQEAALDPAISERARDLVAASAAEVAELLASHKALVEALEMAMHHLEDAGYWVAANACKTTIAQAKQVQP